MSGYEKFVVMDEKWKKKMQNLTENQREFIIDMLAQNIAETQRKIIREQIMKGIDE